MYENDTTEVYDFIVPNFYSDDYLTSDSNELDNKPKNHKAKNKN